MKKILAIAALLLPMLLSAQNNPVADPAAVVTCGNARFTVLTDRLVRMEWAEDGVFEDNATLAIVNRRLPVPAFKAVPAGEGVTIRTDRLTLVYKGGEFNGDNLSVSFRMNGKKVTWTPGADDSGNLLGTARTLDGCRGFHRVNSKDDPIEPGVLSRDGWAIVDESERHILVKDDSDWGEWVAVRPEGRRKDLYIFAYGHDYLAAIGDFTKVAGKVSFPPKYTLGYWWSRYWAYSDAELLQIAGEMKERGIPMDVFIIDMDWHETWKPMQERLGPDELGESRGWTGYTWNRNLFPDPQAFLGELHALGYKTALNLHPASGIRPYEECYERFRSEYLSRTDDYEGPKGYVWGEEDFQYRNYANRTTKKLPAGYNATIPYRLDQQAWADTYFNTVIHPLEAMGVDFWWLDWQQWKISRYVDGLSNTFWANWVFFNDKVRTGRIKGLDADRPFIYHRWGGLGTHRYQLGFSGDTYGFWEVLEFLPYFTATASNVGYGYWGHDIGGHMQKGNDPTDPEMYTRWIQYGVFTPIFKTHSTNNPALERKIWAYPDHYPYMKAAIDLRYALTPYIYDMARKAYDTGVCICRPLYYYYPEEQKAYDCNQEFFFGDNILATVLCKPMDAEGRTERKMWFPAGNDWYDMAHHQMMKGGTVRTLYYTIDENPWYVRAGAMIPLAAEGISNLQGISPELRLLIVPGNGKSTYVHYEDDGISQQYGTQFATTEFTKLATSSALKLTIAPRKGSYKGAPATRKISLVLEGVKSVKSVKVNGFVLAAEPVFKDGALTVVLPEAPVGEKTEVEIIR
ncbi:MAG: DUF5110 domain-containing protein [Bacteroidales bacterium]|nr:DUF5110 domain-containing protein [Bacteroidales bacterium]